MKFIGIVGRTVSENARGYERYEGRLVHWNLVGLWEENAVTDGKIKDDYKNHASYSFDTGKRHNNTRHTFIIIDKKAYTIPNGLADGAVIFFPVLKDLTASQLGGTVIKGNNLHNYDYDGQFSGCQYWCKTVIKVLANNGYIEVNAPRKLDTVIAAVRAAKDNGQEKYVVPDDKGTFYRRSTAKAKAKSGSEWEVFDMDQPVTRKR